MTDSDEKVLMPDKEAKAEPFWAIFETDDQDHATANIFSHGKRVTLFASDAVARQLVGALAEKDEAHRYAVRGVTKAHLEALRAIAAKAGLELWVVTKIEPNGAVEGHPLSEAEAD
jgi:hypothetical protein